MRKTILTLATALAAAPAFSYDFGGEPAAPLLGEAISGGVSEAAKPAYRVIEGLSDGAYWLLRSQFIGRLLPDGLTREMGRTPRGDSYAAFSANFARKQERFMSRLREAYPVTEAGRSDENKLSAWRAQARAEQQAAAADALADSLIDRYGLPRFGQTSADYAKKRRHWTPQFVTVASVLGGAVAYGNGIHADFAVKKLAASVDMKPGHEIASAARGGGTLEKAAEVEVGLKDTPVTLAAAWQVKDGAMRSESLGVKYRLRY